ncbi:HDOD domain-containing protein [Shewanella glacialipiscicola]|uniref:HDOD domain-containing protein n=1 Tax=Shewanella glacialipiscicola TaxID=614069 RepID=UPI003D7BEE1C
MPFNNLDNLSPKTIGNEVLEQEIELLVSKVPIAEYQVILRNENALDKLYSIVVKDAGLSAVFIKIASSAFTTPVHNTKDLRRAIIKLGAVQVVNMITIITLRQLSSNGSGYVVSTKLLTLATEAAIALNAIEKKPESFLTGLALFGGAMIAAAYAEHLELDVDLYDCLALNNELLPFFLTHWSFSENITNTIKCHLDSLDANISLALNAVAVNNDMNYISGCETNISLYAIKEVIAKIGSFQL